MGTKVSQVPLLPLPHPISFVSLIRFLMNMIMFHTQKKVPQPRGLFCFYSDVSGRIHSIFLPSSFYSDTPRAFSFYASHAKKLPQSRDIFAFGCTVLFGIAGMPPFVRMILISRSSRRIARLRAVRGSAAKDTVLTPPFAEKTAKYGIIFRKVLNLWQ